MHFHLGSIEILLSDQCHLTTQLLHGIKMVVALDAYTRKTTAFDHSTDDDMDIGYYPRQRNGMI